MYSRVKRKRKTVKRDMYGIPIEESSEEEESEDSEGSSDGKWMIIPQAVRVLEKPSF